ncbi:hypothetical protein EMPS_03098 [Entomortierella parvispora]|uniref:Uncharacterized protein n=1 Tax=Entomortierella parvispora TaxID=205924 RepID=A0A9P3LU78_9FUNG|nr:hypothetical protein EMPS_03098 [Entomortierella parvispora]
MVSLDEILSAVTTVCFILLFLQFLFRLMNTGFGVYRYILFFCLIRTGDYGIRTYMDTGAAADLDTTTLTDLTIAELILSSIGSVFVMKLFSRLYEPLLPQLRAQRQEGPDLFERCMVQQPKFLLLPIVIMAIIGAIDSTPGHSESTMNLALILRKVAVSLMVLLGLWYMVAATTYRSRYGGTSSQYAFSIAMVATFIFDVALIYKCIYSFEPSLKTTTWVYFTFSPLLEIVGLLVLCQDLKRHFLGDVACIDQDMEMGRPNPVNVGGGRRFGRRFFRAAGPPAISYPQQSAPPGYAPAPAGYYK